MIVFVVYIYFINPRRACAERVTVIISYIYMCIYIYVCVCVVCGVCVCVCVCVSVCLSVCLSTHAILAVRATNERYHRVKRQICGNIKMAFFLKLSYSKVRASFTYAPINVSPHPPPHLRQGGEFSLFGMAGFAAGVGILNP